jgi:hypothetical protein
MPCRLLAGVSGALLVMTLAGCSISVSPLVSSSDTPAATSSTATPTSTSSSKSGSLPGGAQASCLVDDCEDTTGPVVPVGLVCSPLPTAMSAFDEQVSAVLPDGQDPATTSGSTEGKLTDLVIDVVDRCGFQVMVDVANQYRDPLYGWLIGTAVSALGEISALPEGERCADLSALGLGPKQAVDYWFLWSGPPQMDADLDGIPCETVWPDVARYMPAYY